MLNQSILRDGLAIISSCKKETGDIWQAHFGAAAISSYFFVRSNNLSQELTRLVISQAEAMVKMIHGTNGVQRRSGCGEQTAVNAILEALDKTIDQLHWVGHNVIYSAASLLAIHELKGWGSTEDISGITDLIRAFERTIPGRSWIGFSASEVKRMEITDEDGFPAISNPNELSTFVLKQLAEFPVIYRAESHHDLIGHMLTFSHALNILFDLGHISFFERGLPPIMKLIKVLRNSRNVKPGDSIKLVSPVDQLPLQPAKRANVLPIEIKFWEKDYSENDWDYGHVFKFPHSFYDHLRRMEQKKESYIENFRYIIV
ncbi:MULTISPECIES: hypothetical protein [unclassified Paenibacillus]|uniref:hypothetical protein n=1 Tax=unclassified Paenibacillus TaxID=185978 RepID=UPI00278A5FD4|nr:MULTISPECIES: hypothetical protein [unclassified Paenibacillus]MDQ0900856.1 hypothetical protein [Paenibacillus sp. V4I7]MDQ0920635.1 hypothetical protein [Paenibacillus sp. V4I5]